MDYDEYPEYKGEIQSIYHTAMRAIEQTGQAHKCKIYRDLSDNVIPTFPDNYFDIIFIDGNHETEYVYRDGVMSIEKVKSGGYLIFDDFSTRFPQTVAGICKFLEDYKDRLERPISSSLYTQVLVRKL
jgi:predicted O-methyltransferase YrrM